MEKSVLKEGNALDLVHKPGAWSSMDTDLSIQKISQVENSEPNRCHTWYMVDQLAIYANVVNSGCNFPSSLLSFLFKRGQPHFCRAIFLCW